MLQDLRYASQVRKTTGNPFFLNYGLHRPHLPFHFPATFGGENIWEKYGDTDSIALPTHPEAPIDMPGIAFTYEMDGMVDIAVAGSSYPIPGPDNPKDLCPFCGPKLPNNATRFMRKAYYSSVSWIDYLVGEMMKELDVLGHTQDTVIAIVGVSVRILLEI